MNEGIREVAADYAAASERLDRLVGRIDDRGWGTRPRPGAWSVAECVGHLNISAEKYLPEIEKALERARELPATNRPWKLGLFGTLFRALVGPLPRILGRRRFGVPTSEAFTPETVPPREATLAEYRRLHGRLVQLLESCDGVAIDRVKFPSPFDARVKVTPWLSFVILARHCHRHLQQAEDAVEALGEAHPEPRPAA